MEGSEDVIDHLGPRPDDGWKYRSIHAVLNRLVKRGLDIQASPGRGSETPIREAAQLYQSIRVLQTFISATYNERSAYSVGSELCSGWMYSSEYDFCGPSFNVVRDRMKNGAEACMFCERQVETRKASTLVYKKNGTFTLGRAKGGYEEHRTHHLKIRSKFVDVALELLRPAMTYRHGEFVPVACKKCASLMHIHIPVYSKCNKCIAAHSYVPKLAEAVSEFLPTVGVPEMVAEYLSVGDLRMATTAKRRRTGSEIDS